MNQHWRRCFDCGHEAIHDDDIVPEVLCKNPTCKSQDTRKMTVQYPMGSRADPNAINASIARLIRSLDISARIEFDHVAALCLKMSLLKCSLEDLPTPLLTVRKATAQAGIAFARSAGTTFIHIQWTGA